ncbi:MAG: penicillin-binding protein 1C [Desulfovibrionaceae bacterium]|nr:penicillin-binding protein 1C [Desulfovibrionaceae bacterium]
MSKWHFWGSSCLCKRVLAAWALFILLVVLGILSLRFVPCQDPLAAFDFSTVITDRRGQVLRVTLTKDQKYRIRLKLDDLPSHALERVLHYEDRFFWWHIGVNPLAIARACLSMVLGGRRFGGSTLTMQTVRLAYKIKSKTVLGKLKQIFWALVLEQHYSKAEILEAYFNLAPYGGNVEGLAAAARVYFHKTAPNLTTSELEALLLVPQNPVQRKPATDNEVLAQACQRMWHSGQEYAPIRFFSPKEMPFLAPHLTDYLLSQPDLPQGSVITTSLDLNRQRLIENVLHRYIARHATFGINNAAALLVHWPSMEVRSLVGSANFFDPKIQGQIDATQARRSPGSTLKPFIYALALEQGLIHPLTILADTPKSYHGYDPENFDHTFVGPISAAQALRSSRNLPALSLAGRLKNPDLYTFLTSAGVKFQASASHYGLALVLGGAEVSMRELASLYALLANSGLKRPLRFLATDSLGSATPLIRPETAFVTLSMLLEPNDDYQAKTRSGQILPLRLKTGTSNGFRDAWCCGLIGPYVLIVWVGNFDNSSNPLLVGGVMAKPLYLELARALAWAEPMQDSFLEPAADLNVESILVCSKTGDVDTKLCQEKTSTWFIPGVSPVKPTGILRPIEINIETGLRACVPKAGLTRQVIWEFWPSDLAKMFQDAGSPKPPPPPFEEECRPIDTGTPPKITRPKAGLIYHAPISQGGQANILLAASADAGVKQLNWFVNGIFVGSNLPGETLTYKATPGKYRILVSDDLGRTSARSVTVYSAQ